MESPGETGYNISACQLTDSVPATGETGCLFGRGDLSYAYTHKKAAVSDIEGRQLHFAAVGVAGIGRDLGGRAV